MKKLLSLLCYRYIFTLFVMTQTINAEKTPTQEPKGLDDDFFADLFKKPEPKKKAKTATTKKASMPQKTKEIKVPGIKEIQRLEKEISSIGKEITDMAKELTKFPTTEPMKKQIEDLKKEEEKKAQDAEKRRKDILKSSGSSKYKPSKSDYSSGGHRSGGRRYDEDSGSSWSPWGGSGSSDSGGRGHSSLGDSSSSTPSSSFGKDGDKSSTSLGSSTSGTTPDKSTPGGVAGGQSDETTKAATKKYDSAVRLYGKALDRIERYTKGGSEKEKENIEKLLSNPDDCALIIKAINDANDARKGAIPKSVFDALDKQRKGEVTDVVKKVEGALTTMFPIALKAATQIDETKLEAKDPAAQEKIKNDFLSKQIVKDIISSDRYKKDVNEQAGKLLATLMSKNEKAKIVEEAKKQEEIKEEMVADASKTDGESEAKSAKEKVTACSDEFKSISKLLPKVDGNPIDKEIEILAKHEENLNTKIKLIKLNKDHEKTSKITVKEKPTGEEKSVEATKQEYTKLIEEFEKLAKKAPLKKHEGKIKERIKKLKKAQEDVKATT